MQITDEQLVREYIEGDEKSLEILVKRYLDQIYYFSLKFCKDDAIAQDIAQDTFVKVWKKIGQFDTNKNYKAWVYKIARNTALDYLKKNKIPNISELISDNGENNLMQNIADTALQPDDIMELAESDNWFKATVNTLSDKYRRIVILRHEGLSFKEIGLELQEPLNTVKSRYRRALISLKTLINTK